MAVIALISWLVTAAGGFFLLYTWLTRGGNRPRSGSRLTPPLIFGHFGLAAAGLLIWIIYVINDSEPLAWLAFVLLLPVALLGFLMLLRWLGVRREPALSGAGAAESHFPPAVVVGHGAFAAVTLILVLLTALAGDS